MAESEAGSRPGARKLGQPGRDLLLHRQRKVLTPNDFENLDQVRDRLSRFKQLYNTIAQPFGWNFTRDKLNGWLARVTERQNALLPLAA